jgi:DNA polymerase III subunit epsilon
MTQQIQDRNTAVLWARSIFDRAHEYFILDTETTGLEIPEIIELAIIDPSGLMVVNQRFKPKTSIELGATKIHGITNEMLKDCPEWSVSAERLGNILSQRKILIYDEGFATRSINNTYRAHVPYFPIFFTECVLWWYTQYVGEWNERRGCYLWQKLPGGDHSALGDCNATLDVLKRMANSPLLEDSPSIATSITLPEAIGNEKEVSTT